LQDPPLISQFLRGFKCHDLDRDLSSAEIIKLLMRGRRDSHYLVAPKGVAPEEPKVRDGGMISLMLV